MGSLSIKSKRLLKRSFVLNELFCAKHGIHKECMGGCSAHISNWYCSLCDAELLELARRAADAQKGDARSDEQKIADGVAFILDERVGGA